MGAGLGWIGKQTLLITPEYGPRVMLATVLTDAPFKTAKPITESRCGVCSMPISAIKKREERVGERSLHTNIAEAGKGDGQKSCPGSGTLGIRHP